MTKILICTHNQGKFIEISQVLRNLNVDIVSLSDLSIALDVAETGETYEENAILKAKTYGEMSGLISIGDDTGLEVEALDGAPGLHSKRAFKGSGEDRNLELNTLIGDNQNRKAKFVACIAIYNPTNKETRTFVGEVTGEILKKPQGEPHKYQGYDSVFFNKELGKTFAETTTEEKNTVSHRANAVKNALPYLKELINL